MIDFIEHPLVMFAPDGRRYYWQSTKAFGDVFIARYKGTLPDGRGHTTTYEGMLEQGFKHHLYQIYVKNLGYKPTPPPPQCLYHPTMGFYYVFLKIEGEQSIYQAPFKDEFGELATASYFELRQLGYSQFFPKLHTDIKPLPYKSPLVTRVEKLETEVATLKDQARIKQLEKELADLQTKYTNYKEMVMKLHYTPAYGGYQAWGCSVPIDHSHDWKWPPVPKFRV